MIINYMNCLISEDDIYDLYDELGWNEYLQLTKKQLNQAMSQSWKVVYAYDGDRIIGTGRIVSDGIINGYICGIGIHPDYRSKGIGSEITARLISSAKESSLKLQLFCEENLRAYYERLGFYEFAIGMKYEETGGEL